MNLVKNTKRPFNSYADKIRNNKKQKELRRRLRNIPTTTEQTLWKYLKNKQIADCKFRRQYSVGPFVIDFYCPELSLAIEVDGPSHSYNKKTIDYDNRRQKHIESLDIRFLRITNDDIIDNLVDVLDEINKVVCRLKGIEVK